ncbi:MAG: hypothetical protein H6780_02320 [Candidatus Nomurabacteria bacterium]|nr:MAG: hypothetical protein H6780_02320 [Candidatus Nomurabacteria bacterium]
MFGIQTTRLLIASVILGLLTLSLSNTDNTSTTANITVITPDHTHAVHEYFEVVLLVEAKEPVNVFKGILEYDPKNLKIVTIDYNTSVADLWAELPWYGNGNGTLTFIGGTTRSGGFVGNEQLITVTFEAIQPGETSLHMSDIRILRHDGLGSDATVPDPIDSIFTIEPEKLDSGTVAKADSVKGPRVTVLAPANSIDLNADGKQSIADVSIFMAHLATQNLRSDFNHDGVVNLVDLSILNQ